MKKNFEDKLRIETEKIIKLLKDKNDACGFGFVEFGDFGMLVHVSTKVTRLKNLLGKKGKNVKFESIEDSILDLAGYSILWLYLKSCIKNE